MTGWLARLRSSLRGPLDASLRDAFKDAIAEADLRRLRVLLPLMMVLHVAHIAVFHTSDAARATLAPLVVRWRNDVVLAHAVTLALAIPLTVFVYSRPRGRIARWGGAVAALLYLVHGAVVSGVDQLSMANVSAFIGYALGIAVVVCPPPLATIAIYAVGLATFVVAIEVMQPLPDRRLMMLPNGFSSTGVSVALALFLFGARRRDFAQRMTIGRQREELAAMNAGLERRVSEQVSEIVERARQIDELNAQLQAQVRARSTELSMALAKLARDRDADGRLRKGAVLGDRFVIGDPIGEGGMGFVYSGTDRSTEQRVAIKVIQASSAQQLDALHRFLREAGTAATVAHPAVVRMLHVDVSADGMLFQVQELVAGETLSQRLKDGGPWAVSRVARLGGVLCEALAAAHALGVVHRDVKPANIMVTAAAPGLKLLDFGISKVLSVRGGDASSGTGVVIGTPGYMSPEQLSGSRQLTDRADVYAVGVLLFRMITGQLPFDETITKGMIMKRAVDAAPDARTLVASLAPELAEVVAQCLRMEPSERPEAKDVSARLSAFADANAAPTLEVVIQEEIAAKGAARARTGGGDDRAREENPVGLTTGLLRSGQSARASHTLAGDASLSLADSLGRASLLSRRPRAGERRGRRDGAGPLRRREAPDAGGALRGRVSEARREPAARSGWGDAARDRALP